MYTGFTRAGGGGDGGQEVPQLIDSSDLPRFEAAQCVRVPPIWQTPHPQRCNFLSAPGIVMLRYIIVSKSDDQ